MKFVLLHPASYDTTAIADALAAELVTIRPIDSPEQVHAEGVPTVLLLDPPSRPAYHPDSLKRFVDAGGAVVLLGAPDEADPPEQFPDQVVAAFVPFPHTPRFLFLSLRAAYRAAAARIDAMRARKDLATRTREIQELTRIGMALTTERDYNALLEQIITQARIITSSDACSLYLVQEDEKGKFLRFKLTEGFSRPDIPFVEMRMPMSPESLAGYVAIEGQPLVIDDVYFLPPDVAYSFNRSFDQKYGYRSKSMMTIPMKDHKDEVIGVLQLINRKRQLEARLLEQDDFDAQVIPYTPRLVELVSALAGQAAVSIENSQLYEDIERLFEGFVRAAVTAIEQRDPTTFGHSGRVASMTVALAETVDRAPTGMYRHTKFTRDEIREIRYAGLLHDFGKVGVREQVLVKAKKLYPPDLSVVKHRYAFVRRTAEAEFHRQRAEYLEQHGREGYEEFAKALREQNEQGMADLDRFVKLVLDSNEPTVLPEGSFEELIAFADRYYKDLEGKDQPYLTDDEVRFLTIRKGSLDDSERLEIESHVTHTYRFLTQIPWTKELQFIPQIAYGHHEKLNGVGYPRKVRGDQIPIQTRMMTISDIFDALTASDRPYKRAVPVDRAIGILSSEVEGGMLDTDLFNLFVEAKVYERRDEAG
ncbi:MAG TPA: HD domain-containing phosphohydrolase [Gemmatimonadales bacterium]|jgi:HD-GYP domain-containing protein (c-di-GMP phosphodiesterase class II)